MWLLLSMPDWIVELIRLLIRCGNYVIIGVEG